MFLKVRFGQTSEHKLPLRKNPGKQETQRLEELQVRQPAGHGTQTIVILS